MQRIIINEVDNTSNVENLSSYDVAYVPGFSNTADPSLYRVPTLVTDIYSFRSKFGSSAPVFKTTQAYPDSFPEEAIPNADVQATYLLAGTNNFDTDDPDIIVNEYYNAKLEIPEGQDSITAESLVESYQYYYVNTEAGSETIHLSRIDKDNNLLLNINVYLGGYKVTEDSTPVLEKDYYTQTDGVFTNVRTPETFEGNTYYDVDDSIKSSVYSSDYNPSANDLYVLNNSGYTLTHDTYIVHTQTYYIGENTPSPMFEIGWADTGYRYAALLLSMGMPVYYEQMNQGQDDITVENMYAGLAARFTGVSDKDPTNPDYSFDSMGDYSVKFITSGGYPTFEYADNSIANNMIDLARARKDAVALIDHTDNHSRPLNMYSSASVINSIRNPESSLASGDDSQTTCAAMFTPWYECDNSVVTLRTVEGSTTVEEYPNKMMPASLAYLSALATQLLSYNPWLAVAGVTRGKVPYCGKLHTDLPLTNNIADSYQALPNDSGLTGLRNISINPITYIRNYGYCIWGNRTLRNNAGGTKALSFLNIRNVVSDIKKRIYETSQSLLFDQNTDVLWLNFKSHVTPLLEEMVTDYILNDYTLTRYTIDPKDGTPVPAYKVLAVIRIQPINSVEVFELTVALENVDEFVITTAENDNESV